MRSESWVSTRGSIKSITTFMEITTQMDGAIYQTTPVGFSNDALNNRILHEVRDEAVIDLDVLTQMLSEYSWNQIFHAVDQLARAKKIVLRRHHYNYTLFSITHASSTVR